MGNVFEEGHITGKKFYEGARMYKIQHNEESYSEWEKAENETVHVCMMESNIFQYIDKSLSELNFSFFAISIIKL